MSVHPAEPVDATSVVGGGDDLSVLASYEKVYIQQVMDTMQAMTGIDLPNKYQVLDEDDKQIFLLEERNKGGTRHDRAFEVLAKDGNGKTMFSIERDFKACAYCFFCCAGIGACRGEADVKIGGKKAAEIKQKATFNYAKYTIYDKDDDEMFEIKGHSQCCTVNTEYDIYDKKGDKKIGSMDKEGGAMSLGNNRFKVKFPEDASPEKKAILLGMNILLDYRFHYYINPHMRQRRR